MSIDKWYTVYTNPGVCQGGLNSPDQGSFVIVRSGGQAISLKHLAAAAMVLSMSSPLWAAETKAVSNWDGAR